MHNSSHHMKIILSPIPKYANEHFRPQHWTLVPYVHTMRDFSNRGVGR